MRERLIHAYFGVDYQLVWDTLNAEIPELKALVQKILNDLESEEQEDV